MPEELFADSIGAIAITGSVVRIDLVSLSSAEGEAKKQARPVFRQRVVMPVEGFVQSFGVMARAMRQLEERGLVRRNDQPGAAAVAETPAPKPSSPNFKPK